MRQFIECRSVYLGGPISLGGTLSSEEIEENLAKFFTHETKLQALGLAVFNPARLPKYNRRGERASQDDYLEQCFWMVMQADGMVALNGWSLSHGTLREILMAQSAGKPVFDENFAPLGETVEVVVAVPSL